MGCITSSASPLIMDTIRQIGFISTNLDEQELINFGKMIEARNYKIGDLVYSVTDDADAFYIIGKWSKSLNLCVTQFFLNLTFSSFSIAEGQVELIQDDEPVCHWDSLHFFGEEALCQDQTTRLWTIRITEPSTLLVLSRQTFFKRLKEGWLDRIQNHLQSVCDMMKSQVLKNVPFLSGE